MCGTTAGWLVQTCPQAMEAGKLSTPHLRRRARAPSAVALPLLLLSATVRSTSNMTLRSCSLRFVENIIYLKRALSCKERSELMQLLCTYLTYRSEQHDLLVIFFVDRLCVCCVLIMSHMAYITRSVMFPICSGLYFELPLPLSAFSGEQ